MSDFQQQNRLSICCEDLKIIETLDTDPMDQSIIKTIIKLSEQVYVENLQNSSVLSLENT